MAGPGLDLELLIRNEAVVELIRKGDILKIMINVGSSGGHRLIRTIFNAQLELPQYFCE